MGNVPSTYESVPVEMRGLKQWVIWGKNPKKAKMPHSPSSSVEAKANDVETWGSFEEAVAASVAQCRGGIGFEFGEPGGIAGIDLDHVLNEAGELAAWAADIVEAMDSYTELSPSGQGLHILCRITEPMSGFCVAHKKRIDGGAAIEVYDTGRYFTVTGQVYGEAKPLNERTEALKKVCRKYLAKSETSIISSPKNAPSPSYGGGKSRGAQIRSATDITAMIPSDQNLVVTSCTTTTLWERMFEAPNGGEIRALYEGDTRSYGGDASAADLAMCNHLAYWTNGDARRMDEMFRETKLMRAKWDEVHGGQTYGDMTIGRALRDTPGFIPPAKYEKAASTDKKQPPSLSPVEAGQLRPVSEYLPDFLQELLKSREGKAIPTGFDALDDLLGGGLYPGLYCLGAISSLGKTTFALQIADSIAKGGYGVLIFSLEMSRSELMAKTISRESFMADLAAGISKTNAQTTRGILRASFMGWREQEELVRHVLEEYSEWGGNLTIIEGLESVSTSTVERYVQEYVKRYGTPPVVVIDYLQMLDPARGWENATDKRVIDKNVKSLKIISRDYQCPVICISSFNRENYTLPVSMSSFKESGAIEYSSDVLIGLQYAGVDYQEGEGREARSSRIAALIERTREAISQGKAGNIEAKILKNRNGRIGKVRMQFNARFNYFKEAEGGEADA